MPQFYLLDADNNLVPCDMDEYLEWQAYLGARNSRFHMDIKKTKPIPNTRAGNYALLSCGHTVMVFGRLALAGGRAFCQKCFDENKRPKG